MSILYKNARNVRIVLLRKNSIRYISVMQDMNSLNWLIHVMLVPTCEGSVSRKWLNCGYRLVWLGMRPWGHNLHFHLIDYNSTTKYQWANKLIKRMEHTVFTWSRPQPLADRFLHLTAQTFTWNLPQKSVWYQQWFCSVKKRDKFKQGLYLNRISEKNSELRQMKQHMKNRRRFWLIVLKLRKIYCVIFHCEMGV